jgi:hypothetical protein
MFPALADALCLRKSVTTARAGALLKSRQRTNVTRCQRAFSASSADDSLRWPFRVIVKGQLRGYKPTSRGWHRSGDWVRQAWPIANY